MGKQMTRRLSGRFQFLSRIVVRVARRQTFAIRFEKNFLLLLLFLLHRRRRRRRRAFDRSRLVHCRQSDLRLRMFPCGRTGRIRTIAARTTRATCTGQTFANFGRCRCYGGGRMKTICSTHRSQAIIRDTGDHLQRKQLVVFVVSDEDEGEMEI